MDSSIKTYIICGVVWIKSKIEKVIDYKLNKKLNFFLN